MVNTLYLPELREMLAEQNRLELGEFVTALHPARTAEFMEGLTAQECWAVLRHAEPALRAEIFTYFEHEKQVEIIETQERPEIAQLLTDLPADDRVDLLDDVDTDAVNEILPLLPVEERRNVLRLRAYPEKSAGSIMTTEVAMVSETLTVRQALAELSHQGEHLEIIHYIYVVDDDDHLRGVVSSRQLVSAIGKPDTRLSELMETELVSVNVLDDREDAVRRVAQYDLLAIPVVDAERRLVGIITHDDIIDVVREEATADAHRIAGVSPLDQSYLKEGLLTLSWKRGIWLAALFCAGIFTAFSLRHYDKRLEAVIWLIWFVPLVNSSGGNTGSQSATLIITALNAGDVSLRQWRKVVLREIAMGMVLGSFLATMGLFASMLLIPNWGWSHVMVFPLMLISVVVTGTLVGSLLPLLFQRMGLDPALMSNPFVSGIMDIVGITTYMNVAAWLLQLAE
ncbi:MAG TPA: magnesium transporter [Pirellulaceae bacterium]|nr:magnesium transporter [Pirellulaceae bacterium]